MPNEIAPIDVTPVLPDVGAVRPIIDVNAALPDADVHCVVPTST